MYYSNTIFGQLLTFLPRHKLRSLVGQHAVERYVKKVTAWNHLVVLLYAQASGQDSLRSLENSLKVHSGAWHHLGIKSVSRSSIARVNNTRDPIVFEKLFCGYMAIRCNQHSEQGTKPKYSEYKSETATLPTVVKIRASKTNFSNHEL